MIPGAANPLLLGGDGYQIQRSLRLRASATAYLSRAFTSSATWTLSILVKRGALGAISPLLGDAAKYLAGDTLTVGSLTTTAVYRDPSAFHHLVISNSGLSVNGVSLGAVTTSALTNPRIGSNGTNYFDGYIAELVFVDGTALSASSFGQTDPVTGQWTAKKYIGTYGTNGFYLDFKDPTSATTLCYDRSGNGNNWTPNNISTTAGATYDSMLDVPLGGGGNYAVLDRLHQEASLHAIRNGNLTCDTSVASSANVVSTFRDITQGKWYWEVSLEASGAAVWWFGATNGAYNNGVIYYADGTKAVNGTFTAYGASFTLGDVIGVAYDASANTVTFYKNGVSQGAITGVATGASPWFGDGSSSASTTFSVNFGQRPFAYTPPTGFKALHTGNLPMPTGAALGPKKHFDVRLREGTGATASVSDLLFQPDFAWVKARSSVRDHGLFDSVRGVNKALVSNLKSAEQTLTNSLMAFNANGYTVGSSAGDSVAVNLAADPAYVDWIWKAGGAAVTNNAGSISSQVSANVAGGFSIVTYTGTGANATVGHGLGVAPKMVIVKKRTSTGHGPVWHSAISPTEYLVLNLTNAKATEASVWNSTAPASSVISIGTDIDTNQLSNGFVAYCFAEIPGYSKIGSYTGNGSADGPMVWCGFRPRFVLWKRSDSTGDWYIFDTARDVSNVCSAILDPNASYAETIASYVDITSTGFKLRSASAGGNASGGTYIFYAISEAPFKYANAR